MAGGGLPYERWLLVQGGGGEIPCRYKPLTAICNHYNDKHNDIPTPAENCTGDTIKIF